MKLGTIIKVIASCGYEGQDDISELIGKEFTVVGHWKQKDYKDLINKGDIYVNVGKYKYLLNNREYVIVK